METKNNWKDYFSFSKKERNGFIIVLAIVGLVVAYPFIKNKNKDKTNKKDDDVVSSLKEKNNFFSDNENEPEVTHYAVQKEKLFFFDPNSISQEQWIEFGLSPKIASTIINYTGKGGKFYKAEDIRKIWGMKKEDADLLIPFIKIENDMYLRNNYGTNSQKSIPSSVDINTADANTLKKLPGIGDVLSERIVKFRSSINGFESIDDLKKVYGISEATYKNIHPYLTISKKITPSKSSIDNITTQDKQPILKKEKVNINTASEREMVSAGIPRNIARAIKVYRDEKGNFKKAEDLKNIVFINEENYQKVLPFIVLE